MTVLEAADVHKRFGGVVALAGANLELAAGEVHVLIGANGCGKSTLCKIITGSVFADRGTIRLDGRAMRFRTPSEAARAGVGVFYQELSLIPQLTVAENLFLRRPPRSRAGLVDRRRLRREASRALERFAGAIGDIGPDHLVADLSADQRQVVEILKVLVDEPRVILFDEPTAALDNRQVEVFFDLVDALRREGRSIIFISHRMDEVFRIGDRVTVFRNGESVATMHIADTDKDEVVEKMLGTRIEAVERRRDAPKAADVAMRAEAIGGTHFDDVSFDLRRGEILGLGGLHGQGQSSLLRALFGADNAFSGSVAVGGEVYRPRGPRDAIRAGVAYVSGDRGRDGVFPVRPVFENFVAALLTRRRRARLDRRALSAEVGAVGDRLKLRAASLDALISELSGGNQQKVVIGRWLVNEPRILLLDDPTKGIDLNTKSDLYRILDELCMEGVSVVFYSSEERELLANADRIAVFNGGRVVDLLEGERVSELNLYRAAFAAEGH